MAIAIIKSNQKKESLLTTHIPSCDYLPMIAKVASRKTIAAILNQYTVAIALLCILLTSLSATAQKTAPEKPLEYAASLIRNNRIQEAERQLNSILKVAPKEAQALNLLGTIRATQGRLSEAEILFMRAIRLDKQLVGAHMNLAYLYLLKGMPEKTISELKAVLTLAPNHQEAFYKLARLQLSQDHIDECIALLEQAKQAQPTTVVLHVLLGEAYLQKGQMEKAEENYLLALGKQSHAIDALLGLAQVYQAKGDVKTAFHYLARAKEGLGNSSDLLYRFAVTALKIASYEDALSALQQAIKVNPGESAYFLALGAVWLKKPNLFEAEQNFRRVLELSPASSQGQMYLGYTLLKQKKYSEARAYLEKSVKADARIPEPFYYLGLVAQEQNDDARAVDILATVVVRFPDFANAHLALGSSFLKLKNYPRAKQELELAVQLNPDEPKAHYNLALLYARLKDPERAQKEMQIVERLKGNKGQAHESDTVTPPLLRPQ